MTVVVVLAMDVLASNGLTFRGSGYIYLLLVIFVTYWSGLWIGLASTLMIVAYIPIAANVSGSALYGIGEIERRMLTAGIVLAVFSLVIGIVQNKLRSAAVREFDLQEAAEKEAEQRQRAESELRHSEQLRSIVVDSSMDAVVAIDVDGVVTLWNPSAEKLFGWTSDEIIGRRLSKTIIPERYRLDHERGMRHFRESGEGKILGQRLELTALSKGGREFEVELTVVPHRSDGETVFVGFLRDVSEQKRLQQELLTAQKLESVGQLAGGVAHDFNNVLSVIVGYGELAKRQLDKKHEVQRDLDEMLLAARRCFDINNQLLAFARKQITEPRVVSLNQIIEDIRPMFRTLIKEDIELSYTLTDDLWPVQMDPGQFEQLLTNLVINARDAMPVGGKLMIETRNVTVEEDDELPVPDIAPGDYATVSVSDTGTGIPRENLDKIFEPFFSTKEGRGSGLGLASAYGSVKQAGGRISVYSEPGHGTMFRVYLPRTTGEIERIAVRPAKAPAARGTETVLVAEDNEQVRQVVRQSLEHFGYSVLVASSGEEALAIARGYDGEIELLVTDLIMPRGAGTDLARQLLEERPGTKVIFLSGYTEEAVSQRGVEGIAGAFLQKPVMPSDLAAKVREVLDDPASVSQNG